MNHLVFLAKNILAPFKVLPLIILMNFLLIISVANAQTVEITGSLVDSTSNKELPYGTLSIRNQNDSLIRNTITNDHGKFWFKNIESGDKVYLTARYLGFKERTISFRLNKKTKINNVKILLVPQITNLNQTEVVGSVSNVVKKFDRTVYKMNSGQVAAARTVLDLLRTLPGVVVDDKGNVRYKGSTATIYVDDQPLNFQFPSLEMIPVDKIDKIELIDAAMFSGGNGEGGIINIKLKPVNKNGVSGMLNAKSGSISFNRFDNSSGFLNVNYKSDKLTIFLNTSIDNSFINENSINNNIVNIPSISSIQNINSLENDQRWHNYNNAGIIYRPSSDTKLYLSCGLYTLNYKSDLVTAFLEHDPISQQILNGYNDNESYNDNQLYEGLNFSYWHQFGKLDTYIKIYGSYNNYKISSKQDVSYHFSQLNAINADSTYSYSNNRYINAPGIYLNIFYNHSVSKNTRWNLSYNLAVGLKDSTANTNFIFGEKYLPQSQFSADKNQRHNLSWRIGTKFKKWKLDGGLTVVDNRINGNYIRYNSNLQDTIIPLKKNYFGILPSATFAYEINKKNEIKLTLSQTSNFPIFNKLSDYIDKNNLYNWYSGNSELKRVNYYSAYLGYSHIIIDKWNASTNVFYNYTNNEVANLSIPLTSLLTLTKPENIAQKSNVGIDLAIWYKVNKQFNFSLSSTLYYLLYNLNALKNTALDYNLPSQELIQKEFGYTVKLNAEYILKDYYFMFYFNYYARELTFDGYNNPWINSSFNASKKFLDKKLRVSVSVDNIFNDMIEHGSYTNILGVSSETTTSGLLYKRLFMLAIQYNFGEGDRGTKDLRLGGSL